MKDVEIFHDCILLVALILFNEINFSTWPSVITSINLSYFSKVDYMIYNLNECNNTAQENRHRLTIAEQELLKVSIYAKAIERLRRIFCQDY